MWQNDLFIDKKFLILILRAINITLREINSDLKQISYNTNTPILDQDENIFNKNSKKEKIATVIPCTGMYALKPKYLEIDAP